MDIEKEFATRVDQTSHSPRGNLAQGPTRATQEAPVHDSVEDRRGSVGGPTIGGNSYAAAETIEHRWKGKKPADPKGHRFVPAPPPEQDTWIDRLEEVGKDGMAIHRSSEATDVVLDKISDTLSSWSASLERATMHGDHPTSWSEKALSFLRHKPATNHTSSSTSSADKQPQCRGQHDVECMGSDDHYDATQGSFRLEPESVVINEPARPLQKQRGRSHSHQEFPSATTSKAQPVGARRRRSSIHDPNEPSHWFDTNPESARVSVPPLSTNPPETPTDTATPRTQLLYDQKSPTAPDAAAMNHPGNTQDLHEYDRRFHVVESKKSPGQPCDWNADNLMDSDFENWKPHPASHKKKT
ncbi:hypothetical protein BX666DRAFT_1877565 [Dichotomocladium elegans]|nr:hypothetical protein BX666DRAFT_1877565 [Dichotomocladium elegans]